MCIAKTIVLWGHDDLLSSFLEHFLVTRKGWEVINLSISQNLDALVQVLDITGADVLIIQLGDHVIDPCIPQALQQSYPGLRVITLSLNDNLMEVYSKQNILVQSAEDLITVLDTSTTY